MKHLVSWMKVLVVRYLRSVGSTARLFLRYRSDLAATFNGLSMLLEKINLLIFQRIFCLVYGALTLIAACRNSLSFDLFCAKLLLRALRFKILFNEFSAHFARSNFVVCVKFILETF